MISRFYDINHDIDHDIDHDIIANIPATSDGKSHSFEYGIMKYFNMSISPFTGELGRWEERAEVLKSWMACALRQAPVWRRQRVQDWRWRPMVVGRRRDEVWRFLVVRRWRCRATRWRRNPRAAPRAAGAVGSPWRRRRGAWSRNPCCMPSGPSWSLKWNRPPARRGVMSGNAWYSSRVQKWHVNVRTEKIEELLLAQMHPVLEHSSFSLFVAIRLLELPTSTSPAKRSWYSTTICHFPRRGAWN